MKTNPNCNPKTKPGCWNNGKNKVNHSPSKDLPPTEQQDNPSARRYYK